MGHCQSRCCPHNERRPKPNVSRHVGGVPLSTISGPASSDTTGSVSSAGYRYRLEVQDRVDHPKNSLDSPGDVLRGSTSTRCASDAKAHHSDSLCQHSDRPSSEKKKASQNSNSGDAAFETRINRLFEHYSDSVEEECIAVSGIERLCADLNIEPEDFRVLLFAWQCGAQTMCRLTRAEFVAGCKRLHADTTSAISSRLPFVIDDIRCDRSKFRDLYRWSYGFALDSADLQRTLPLDMAIAMWRLVFSGMNTTPTVLPQWFEYLEKRNGDVRVISRDTWEMFLVFVETVGDDLGSYNDCEAWPTLLDDFVEYENDRRNQNLLSDLPEKEY
jgi:DCN1-like protein 3